VLKKKLLQFLGTLSALNALVIYSALLTPHSALPIEAILISLIFNSFLIRIILNINIKPLLSGSGFD
jgi:hypothetical protein